MITIRLARGGAKRRPFYHVVVTDSRSPRDGRHIERLGYYNGGPQAAKEPITLNFERIEYWKGKGASVSERVQHLIKLAARGK